MRNGDTKQNSCDIIANQRKGDYMKSNLEIKAVRFYKVHIPGTKTISEK